MWRAVRLLLFCAALGGCSATSGGIASLTSIGGSGSSDMPSKAAATPVILVAKLKQRRHLDEFLIGLQLWRSACASFAKKRR